jgi:hypothetical protein
MEPVWGLAIWIVTIGVQGSHPDSLSNRVKANATFTGHCCATVLFIRVQTSTSSIFASFSTFMIGLRTLDKYLWLRGSSLVSVRLKGSSLVNVRLKGLCLASLSTGQASTDLFRLASIEGSLSTDIHNRRISFDGHYRGISVEKHLSKDLCRQANSMIISSKSSASIDTRRYIL